MGRRSRYRTTADVKRVASGSDGYGGLAPTETTVVTAYKFMYWHLSPWDREAVVTKYGLETDTILRMGAGDYNTTVQNNDILDVSATERWQILTTNEVLGRDNAIPVSMCLLLARAGDRP